MTNNSFEINNIFIGVARYSVLDRILFLNSNETIKNTIISNISTDYSNYLLTKENIEQFKREALIDEDLYFLSKDDLNDGSYLEDVTNNINIFTERHLNSSSHSFDSLNLKEYKKELNFSQAKNNNEDFSNDKYDTLNSMFLENNEELIILWINSRDIIRDKNFIDLVFNSASNQGRGTAKANNIVEVNTGIHIPTLITAIYNFEEKKLYVLNLESFERMTYTYEKNKELAQTNFSKFSRQEFTIGETTNSYTVNFENPDEIERKIIESKRYTKRLANYDNDDTYSIEKVKSANEKIPAPSARVTFDDEQQTINVTEDNYPTFIAIIHNSIVERLISGEVVVI